MLVTAPLTAHVNRWVIQLSSYCGVNELGSVVQVCIHSVCACVCLCACVNVCVIPDGSPEDRWWVQTQTDTP